jgi:hypothetical protein
MGIMKEKAEALHADLQYALRFRALLRDVAESLKCVSTPSADGTEFWSFYSPAEVVSGISASEELGLGVDQAVAYFVFSFAVASADAQMRGGFFQRLKMKLPPIPGTGAHAHLAMTNYVLEKFFDGHGRDPKPLELFAERYGEERPPIQGSSGSLSKCRRSVVQHASGTGCDNMRQFRSGTFKRTSALARRATRWAHRRHANQSGGTRRCR